MKTMKSAEQWANDDLCLPEPYPWQLKVIRQIQADTLRWAMETANEYESFISRGYIESLKDKANQLDPIPTKS